MIPSACGKQPLDGVPASSWPVEVVMRRLARGFVGRVARRAVRMYPFVYGDRSRVRIADGVVLDNAILNCSSGR